MQSQSQGAEQISESMADLTSTASQTMDAIGEYCRAAADLREAISSLQESVATFRLRDARQ
jgi:methyl-accepting chemotaxis protein WspA